LAPRLPALAASSSSSPDGQASAATSVHTVGFWRKPG
jgi:hypothetical protein